MHASCLMHASSCLLTQVIAAGEVTYPPTQSGSLEEGVDNSKLRMLLHALLQRARQTGGPL